jgi:hypothetical protein
MEQQPNSLSQEIQAMADIGQALGSLTDPAARQRVLQWAAACFAPEVAVGPAPPVAAPTVGSATASDPDLAIGSLTEMFAVHAVAEDDDLGEFAAPAEMTAPETAKLPLDAALRSFAADFRAFADEWNGATA